MYIACSVTHNEILRDTLLFLPFQGYLEALSGAERTLWILNAVFIFAAKAVTTAYKKIVLYNQAAQAQMHGIPHNVNSNGDVPVANE